MRVVVKEKPRQQPQKIDGIRKEEFSLWLKKVPLDFLQDVYRHYRVRRDIPVRPFFADLTEREISQEKEGDTHTENAQGPPSMQPIVLRRSVFFLIFSLLGIELFFDLIYVGLRLLLMYANLSQYVTTFSIESLYFGILVFLNISKVIFMIVAALEWISFTYEINGREIVSKYGILNHKEKVYLCTYIQEVMYTQSLTGKMFNYGTIELHNPTFDEIVYLDSVPNPQKHAEIIKRNLPTERKKELIPIQMQT